MDIVGVKTKIQLLYQDQKALERIWSLSSDFLTEADKNLASFLISSDVSYLKELSKTSEFKALQDNIQSMEDFLEHLPEAKDYLDTSKATVSFYLKSSLDNFNFEELEVLIYQVSLDKILPQVSFETAMALTLILGDRKSFKEELQTTPDPEDFKSKVEARLKTLGVKISLEEDLEDLILSGQDLKMAPEAFLSSHYQALVRSFFLWPDKIDSNVDFFIKNKASAEKIKEIWQEVFEKMTKLTLEDHESLLDKVVKLTTIKSTLLEEMIVNSPANVVFLLKKQWVEEGSTLDLILKVSEKTQSPEVFKNLWDLYFQDKYSKEYVQKLCLKLNNSLHNPFYLQIWDYICQEYVLEHMPRGNFSFSHHYPSLYEVVANLDNEKVFYTEKDLVDYLKSQKLENKELSFIKDLLKDMSHKLKIVSTTLEEDLKKGVNRYSQWKYQDQEVVVLLAFKEKVDQTRTSVEKLLEKTNKNNFSIKELFYTQEGQHSLSNLKGFFLGELKVGGLENYQGHGKQLRQILEPLGFVLSLEIKKEIDHYIKLQEDNKIKLLLVESKNFKKVLTRRNPRLYDILNQKKRLNLSVDKAFDEISAQDPLMSLEVFSSLYLSRGLSKKSKALLLREQGYDAVEGMELDFSSAEALVSERLQTLLERIKKRIEKNLSLEPELFEEHYHDISNLILMIEEDKEDALSDGKDYSDTMKTIVKSLAKHAATDLKDKYGQTKEIFASLVKVLYYKVQKQQKEEEAV